MSYKIEKRIIPGLTQKALNSVDYVVAHESGNPNNTGPNSLEAEINYMTNNWRNAFTSHWVGGGGRIVQLAQVGKFQYGAGPKANGYSYAHVEVARTKIKSTFEKDYAAYVWLLRKLAKDAGLPVTFDRGGKGTKGIKSHDWIRKNLGGTTHTDPFAYFASFGVSREKLKNDVEKGVDTITVTPPENHVKSDEIKNTDKPVWTKITGSWTGQTLRNGQYGEPVKQLQTKLANNKPPFYPNKGAKNNGIDSYYGDDTEDAVRRFQSVNGLAVDGLAGKDVYAKLGGKTTANLKVDGYWGAGTTKALQRYFNTPVDGKISKVSPMIKKLQKLVGVTADGIRGPKTYRAMQKRFGTPVDGKISKPSVMVKEMQRRLNAGKL